MRVVEGGSEGWDVKGVFYVLRLEAGCIEAAEK